MLQVRSRSFTYNTLERLTESASPHLTPFPSLVWTSLSTGVQLIEAMRLEGGVMSGDSLLTFCHDLYNRDSLGSYARTEQKNLMIFD